MRTSKTMYKNILSLVLHNDKHATINSFSCDSRVQCWTTFAYNFKVLQKKVDIYKKGIKLSI